MSLTKGRLVESVPVADHEIDIGEPLDTAVSSQPSPPAVEISEHKDSTGRHNGAVAVGKTL